MFKLLKSEIFTIINGVNLYVLVYILTSFPNITNFLTLSNLPSLHAYHKAKINKQKYLKNLTIKCFFNLIIF